jgi:prepilin-type N-terminal cleavage/methylation domain-containing protein
MRFQVWCLKPIVGKIKSGFTLIELIMTIVLLGIVSLATGAFVTEQIRGVARSSEYTQALNLAQLELETVNHLAYANITNQTITNYESYPYDVVRTVTFNNGTDITAESLKKIVIEVRKTGTTQDLVNITTYIARNVALGL